MAQPGWNQAPTNQSWHQSPQQSQQWQQQQPPPPPPPQNRWQQPPAAPPPQQGYPPQQQQSQQYPPQEQQGYPNQQHQQYPNQQGGYYQPPPPGCCAPADPNQPPTPCCGPPPGQQPQYPPGVCGCLNDPTYPCCPAGEQSPCYCMTSCCDFATWLVGLMTFLAILGFALVLATNKTDNIMKVYSGVSNAAELTIAMMPDILVNETHNISVNASMKCAIPKNLRGSFGTICAEHVLLGVPMMMNLSQWNNFRGTLYFLAMLGTFAILFCICAVHRTKHPNPWNQQWQNPQQQQYQGPPVQPAIDFYGTPLYHVFRAAWFAAGCITFFWFVNEMYQYWWFIDFYKKNTKGAIHDFWSKYDKKFISTVLIVFFYLAWPIINLALEAIVFVFVVPFWACYRAMCNPTLETIRPPEGTKFEDIPFCVRLDMFFCECNQGKRAGFGMTLWELVTGVKTPYFDCCEMQGGVPQSMALRDGRPPQAPPPPGGQLPPRRADDDDEVVTSGQWNGRPGSPTRGFAPQPSGTTPNQSRDGLPPRSDTPNQNVRRSKSWVESENSDDGGDKVRRSKSGKHSKEKRSHEKKEKHSSHHRSDSRASYGGESGNEDLRASRDKRSKSDKKDKRDKKEKHSRSRSNLDEASQ